MASVSDSTGSPTPQENPSRPTSPRPGEVHGAAQPAGFPGLPAGWRSDWETFRTPDAKHQLFAAIHTRDPWKGHRALIVIHGMGDHGGRFFHVPHYVQDVVDAVYCLDLRGHGRSEGLRGHADQFDLLVDDVAHAVRRLEEQIRKRFGKAEIHLLGQSMGGHLVVRSLLKHPDLPLASAAVTAPFLGFKFKAPFAKAMAARFIHHIWGAMQFNTGLVVGDLSRDKAVCKAYEDDRLVHEKMTADFYITMIASMADTVKHDAGIKVPLQMMVPLQDAIVDPEASLAFFRALKHRDKQLKTYPGFYHEPLNELGKEQVFTDLADWIRAHSAGVVQ